MYNSQIAEIFEEIADMLELDKEKDRKFEILAYRKAAVTIGTLQEDVGDIYRKRGLAGLQELPGIGKSTSEHIKEYIETGRLKKYDELKKKYPIDFARLTNIQGLGAKRILKLYKMLGVKNIDDLKRAIKAHEIRDLEGFGEKSESEIGKSIAMLESSGGRMLLGIALPEAERIRDAIRNSGLVERVEIGGSTRRMKETVGDLDILVISSKSDAVMDFVSRLSEVERTLAKGPTKTTVRLKIGLNCDIRVLEKSSFGAAIQYFTGNKDHNVKLRQIAIGKGLKLNEYGLFDKKGTNTVTGSEEEIYRKLGLDWIEPEMREDRGEIELAQQHKLPRLVQLGDVRGDLHVHSRYTDGANSIEEIADEAAKLGREYIGMTDHSKSEYVTGGMTDKEFEKYFAAVDKINDKFDNRITLLKSSEMDILKDGSLDLQNKTLDSMDYRLAAVHTSLKMDEDEMTKRIIKAFDTGYINIFAHPTERIINQRPPIKMNLDKIFEAAKDNGVALEIDSFPNRLDLSDENILLARKYGVKFAIDTDAHRTEHLKLMRYGVSTAKRGWLTKDQVINTRSLKELRTFFKR